MRTGATIRILMSAVLLVTGCDVLGLGDDRHPSNRIALSKTAAVPGEVVIIRNLPARAGGAAVQIGTATITLSGTAAVDSAAFVVPELAPSGYEVRIHTRTGETLDAGRLQVRSPTFLGGKPEVAIDSMQALSIQLGIKADQLAKAASYGSTSASEKVAGLSMLAGEMLDSLERGLQRLTPQEEHQLALMISANPEILNALESIGSIISIESKALQAASHTAPRPIIALRDTSTSQSVEWSPLPGAPTPIVAPGARVATEAIAPIVPLAVAQEASGPALSPLEVVKACRSMKAGVEALEEVAFFVNIAAIAATAGAVGTVGATTPGAVVLGYMAVATNLTLVYLNTVPFLLDNGSLELRVSPARVKAGSSNGIMTARVRRISPLTGLGAIVGVVLASPGASSALSRSAEAVIRRFAAANRELLGWLAHPSVRSSLATLGADKISDRLAGEIAKVDEALHLSDPFAEATSLTFEGIQIQSRPEWSVRDPSSEPNRRIIVADMPVDTTIELNATLSSPDRDCGATASRRDLDQGINGFRIDGSFPPVITALVFPTVVSNVPGAVTSGRVEFEDREGDVVQLEATVAGVKTVVYDLSVEGVKRGWVPISVLCPPGEHTHCSAGPHLLRAVLIDRHGNRSKPAEKFFFAE